MKAPTLVKCIPVLLIVVYFGMFIIFRRRSRRFLSRIIFVWFCIMFQLLSPGVRCQLFVVSLYQCAVFFHRNRNGITLVSSNVCLKSVCGPNGGYSVCWRVSPKLHPPCTSIYPVTTPYMTDVRVIRTAVPKRFGTVYEFKA